MRRALAVLLLLLGFGATAIAAQVRGPRPRPMLGFQPPPGRWIPFVGARYSTVQGVSASVLLLRDHSAHGEEYSGVFGAAEAGLHGVAGSGGEGGWAVISGASLRATYLRTYGSGGRLAGGQDFVGGEFRISVRWWTFGGGWYRRVAGNAPGDRSSLVFTAGLGY